MTTGSWGVSLNGVYLSGGMTGIDENLEDACAPQNVVGCITTPPVGLGLPGLRTEDVTFVQRDGVKHYSDWYEARQITIEKVVICDEGCGSTPAGSARQKVRDLLEQWRRVCCDTELVIYTPHNSDTYESVPTPQLIQERVNLFSYNTLGQAYTSNCGGVFEFTNTRGFGSATGTYSTFVESLDMPLNLTLPQSVARKTWNTSIQSYCRDYTPGRCYTTISPPVTGFKYDNVSVGSNNGTGFIMGCAGADAVPVTPDESYAFSGWMRTNLTGVNLLVRVFFYDESGAAVATSEGDIVTSVANEWSEVSTVVLVPADAVTMQFALDVAGGGTTFSAGDHLDATAVMVEKSTTLGSYFHGNFLDTDDATLGGTKVEYSFDGAPFASPSRVSTYTYVAGRDRGLNGPFGVVGRPRIAEVTWSDGGFPCATVLLRFDAVDHRLYVLDDCGTPGYTECALIVPGSSATGRIYDRCYTNAPDNTWCYDTNLPGSVSIDPKRITVLGTETSYPVITFNPSLTAPRLEDVTTGKSITYRGTLANDAQPVIVYTEDGTAYQGNTSVTHLIDGSLDFSFEPGFHDLRLISQSLNDTGDVSVCWRASVISA